MPMFPPVIMPRRVVGVSLKMYMGLARTRDWMEQLRALAGTGLPAGVELFVIPSFLSLADARAVLAGTGVALGAQDVFWEDCGAFTGEVSAPMLAEAGCRYVEVGHAERRRIFGETDRIVCDKVTACARAGLVPVLCIGEAVRLDPDASVAECIRQFAAATANIEPAAGLVVAWEPVWAIGADAPAPTDFIIAVATGLRAALAGRPNTRLIYGGSAGPGLLRALKQSVDGLFLGRFAHSLDALHQVLAEAAETESL